MGNQDAISSKFWKSCLLENSFKVEPKASDFETKSGNYNSTKSGEDFLSAIDEPVNGESAFARKPCYCSTKLVQSLFVSTSSVACN